MPDRDTPLVQLGDIATAVALLTRLPISVPARQRGAAAAWAYPLAGLAVGLVAALTGTLAAWLGLSAALAAGLVLLSMIVATGALHEDGLADTADGLWGGWTAQKRLEIMKDSRIGTYGVIALVLSLGLRWAALAALATQGGLGGAVLAAAALSRAPMLFVMHALPSARDGGLSASVGRPGRGSVILGLGIAAILGGVLTGTRIFPLLLLLSLTTFAIAAIAKAKIGGQTGDILGATQQISEIAILAYLAS